MPRFTRLALRLVLPLLVTAAAQAEGLVQLTLRGEIATPGGAPVELHLGFWDGAAVRAVDLRLHLAQSTSARDVAHLLAARLRRQGAEFQYPGEHETGSGSVQLFLEKATLVSLRLGHGLSASVTVTEGAPETVRFLTPLEIEEPVEIAVCVTTFHPHTKKPGRVSLSLRPEGDATSSSICETLFNDGMQKGLTSDRASVDRWRPTKTAGGAQITGCSIDLISKRADWGLEVQLGVPRER